MVDVASKAESTRSGSRWTKLMISLQRRTCVVLWLSRSFQLSMMLQSCLRHRSTPNRSQVLLMPVPWRKCVVPLANKRLAQWTTSEEDIGHREFVSGQEEREFIFNHLESRSCCGARVVRALFRQCALEHVRLSRSVYTLRRREKHYNTQHLHISQ